jgi:hypothetical protein
MLVKVVVGHHHHLHAPQHPPVVIPTIGVDGATPANHGSVTVENAHTNRCVLINVELNKLKMLK